MNVNVVEVQGLEPRIKEPKSSVLPLHHTSAKKTLPLFTCPYLRYRVRGGRGSLLVNLTADFQELRLIKLKLVWGNPMLLEHCAPAYSDVNAYIPQ